MTNQLKPVLAVAMNIAACFFSDRIVLRMNRARALTPQAAPRLSAMVEDLAARVGIPTPKLRPPASARRG